MPFPAQAGGRVSVQVFALPGELPSLWKDVRSLSDAKGGVLVPPILSKHVCL